MGRSKENRGSKGSKGDEVGVTLGSQTHVGMKRAANQDAYCAILAPSTPPGTDALLAVADGMGGHQAGEVASAMAIQGLVRRLSPQNAGGTTPLPKENRPAFLGGVVQQVNADIHQAGQRPETQGMGTTLTMALRAGSSLSIAHVGDSRVYLHQARTPPATQQGPKLGGGRGRPRDVDTGTGPNPPHAKHPYPSPGNCAACSSGDPGDRGAGGRYPAALFRWPPFSGHR